MRLRSIVLFVLCCMSCVAHASMPVEKLVTRLQVPPGFTVTLYAGNVPNAREMAWGDHGTLFVGSFEVGKVYALRDDHHDGRARSVRVIASGLRMPVGVAFRNGSLYVSAVDRILRFDDIEARLDAPPKPVVVVSDLPGEAHHGWRYLAFGPDGKLYVPIGAPCNVCDKPGYAKLIRMNPDGSKREDVALGIRNTVGFSWSPVTGKLWFTDNGRDSMGDDVPDDKLNVVTGPLQHFGFPYCHGGDVLDPEFGKGKSCHDYMPPAAKMGAHVANLGIAFYTGKAFPAAYRNNAFIAEHGSWDRSSKVGYRVVRVEIDGDKVLRVTPFLTGFLDGQTTLGRPVAVINAPDGSLLVSDDFEGAIYRITYKGVPR
jgi:glucose/arabinose dehydrogenase